MVQITDQAVALAVINEAKARGIPNADTPENPAEVIGKAQHLYDLALQAKNAGVGGEAIEAVLAAAGQGGAAPQAAPAVPDPNPFDQQQVVQPPAAVPVSAPPAPAPQTNPVAPAPAEPTAQASIDDVIPGYDNLKVDEILTAMEGLTDEQIAFVKAYEAQDGERGKILKFERHPMVEQPPSAPVPQAPPAAAVPAQVDQSQHSSVEPWQGYNAAKIKDIMAHIENVFRTQGEAAKPLLAHVWAFEKANKNRTTLINKLTELAQNGVQVSPPTQVPPEPAPAQVPPSPTPAEGSDVIAQPPFQQPQQEAAPVPPPAPQAPSTPTPPSAQTTSSAGIADPVPGGATEAASLMIGQQLPIPPEWQGEFPNPSNDFTTLTDIEVAKYQSQFNALHSRAIFVLAQAEGNVADAKRAAERLIQQYVASKEWAAKATDTSKEAEATQNSAEIQAARKVQHDWSQVVRQVSALATGYEKTAERLSREQTRREKDREHSR